MSNIGLVGVGVMGKGLALNMERNGYLVSVYNYTPNETKIFINNEAKDKNIYGFYDLSKFVNSLDKPRKVFLMITAGKPVDEMIKKLIPLLEPGDIIMDGGNSYFKDTSRRFDILKEKGIHYLGIGISGGEEGALNGPSLMPGGSIEAYDLVKDILTSISAKTKLGACCEYVGNDSAGHFVKMVHNGIEYGMMQAISEVYDVMRKALKISTEDIGNIFETWNNKELNSFLMEISYKIMRYKDNETNKPLVELILDKAGQKGTGKWTSQASLDIGIPTPSITAAVQERNISFYKKQRINLSNKVKKQYNSIIMYNKDKVIEELKDSLMFSDFILFSQGLWCIKEASDNYDYDINILKVLKIWNGGCIIRAKMLELFRKIISEDSKNVNLLNNQGSLDFLMSKIDSLKDVVDIGKNNYIPMMVHNTSLDYFYSMIEENHPANLIQAQRDFFGAHTYERVDKKGVFHTKDWDN